MNKLVKTVLFGLVCIAALAAGAWSEVLAGALTFKYHSRGFSLSATAVNFDSTAWSSSASVSGFEGVAGDPGAADRFAIVSANGEKLTVDSTGWTQDFFSASGEVDASAVNVNPSLKLGDVSAVIPGTHQVWTTSSGWTSTPVDVSVAVALLGESEPVTEMSMQRVHNRDADYVTAWKIHASSVFDTSGVMSIDLSDGTAFVPAGSPTSWGSLRKHRNSNMFVQQP